MAAGATAAPKFGGLALLGVMWGGGDKGGGGGLGLGFRVWGLGLRVQGLSR